MFRTQVATFMSPEGNMKEPDCKEPRVSKRGMVAMGREKLHALVVEHRHITRCGKEPLLENNGARACGNSEKQSQQATSWRFVLFNA